MSNQHAPSFPLTKLYRRKSEKSGATYFTGRLGGARIALLKSNETGDDGSEVWNLVISEALAKRDHDAGQRKEQDTDRRQPAAAAATRDWQRPNADDEIPF